MSDLLNGLKSNLNIPDEVTNFDNSLELLLKGSKSYVDSIIDDTKDAQKDPLYVLAIENYAMYQWLNRDEPNLKNLPVGLVSLLNRLKDKYLS